MTREISFSPYLVRIRAERKDEFFTLDNLPNGKSFFTLVKEYFAAKRNLPTLDEEAESALKTAKCTLVGDTRVWGIVKSGDYGLPAELQNAETHAIKQRDIKDIEFIPYFLFLDGKKSQNEAILFLQRLGNLGVKTQFRSDLEDYVTENKKLPWVLEFNPLITEKAIKEVLGGRLKSIRYHRLSVHSDVADALGLDDNIEDAATMELRIKAKKNRTLDIPQWMYDVAMGKTPAGEHLEIREIVYDSLKIEVELENKKKKILSIDDLKDRLRFNEDVTDAIEFDGSGHPTHASLLKAAEGLLPRYRKAVAWRYDQ